MEIKIIAGTALKGKGQVKIGDTFTEKDADPVELKRLVAYGKAVYVNGDGNDKPKVNLNKGLNTKTAGAIK